jgi:hypothetical protein
MTHKEIVTANKTARSSGAVGKKALLPRIIKDKMPCLDSSILDFGSGPKAMHTLHLREKGYRYVDAFDMGSNYDPKVHIVRKPEMINSYDIVMASNVINVLSSLSAIKETIHQISWFTNHKGVALINLPTSPRKYHGLNKRNLLDLLSKEFVNVMVENHHGTKIFYCYKQDTT